MNLFDLIAEDMMDDMLALPRVMHHRLDSVGYYRGMVANLHKTETGYMIEAQLPGFKKHEIEITPLSTKSIKVVAETKCEDKKEHEHCVREFSSERHVERVFALPENVKVEDVTAKLEDGILTIDLPINKEELKKSKIEIR